MRTQMWPSGAAAGPGRTPMRLFIAGLRKLMRRPATWVTLALGRPVGVDHGGGRDDGGQWQPGAGWRAGRRRALLLVTFPGAYTIILFFLLGLGGLFAVLYGAAIAGSEWNWGTLKSAVARGESRCRYVLWHRLDRARPGRSGGVRLRRRRPARVVAARSPGSRPTDHRRRDLGRYPRDAPGWVAIVEAVRSGSPSPHWRAVSSQGAAQGSPSISARRSPRLCRHRQVRSVQRR